MNKADLVRKISRGTGLTRDEVAAVVEGVLESITDELVAGGHVELRSFGTFRVVTRAPRIAYNPRTGEPLRVPEKRVPVFVAAGTLKKKVLRSGS